MSDEPDLLVLAEDLGDRIALNNETEQLISQSFVAGRGWGLPRQGFPADRLTVAALCNITRLFIDTQKEQKATVGILREWIDKQGHDRCWYYPDIFNRLCQALGIERFESEPMPTIEEFERRCREYQAELYGTATKEPLDVEHWKWSLEHFSAAERGELIGLLDRLSPFLIRKATIDELRRALDMSTFLSRKAARHGVSEEQRLVNELVQLCTTEPVYSLLKKLSILLAERPVHG